MCGWRSARIAIRHSPETDDENAFYIEVPDELKSKKNSGERVAFTWN
jgi:hypothetical protein